MAPLPGAGNNASAASTRTAQPGAHIISPTNCCTVQESQSAQTQKMGYGDYTFDSLLGAFGLTVAQLPLFTKVAHIAPTDWLTDTLQKGRSIAFYSEKSRSEFIVAPVLLSCQELLKNECCLYSGIRLDVDPDRGLNGECDFILAKAPPTPALRAPLMIVVEAKKNDIEEALVQCAAQMVAARLFNE